MDTKSIKRYSKQRDTIMQVLAATSSHPTAISVYNSVRDKLPHISLGTVYRNLARLAEDGDILKIGVGDGSERYDACSTPHYHMICKCCGSVSDVPIKYSSNLDKTAHKLAGAQIDYHNLVFCGVCESCIKNNSKK